MTILLAVLVQYTPLRYCAVERMVLGSNCHDRADHAILGDAHSDDATCGTPDGGQHNCVCEQPKVDALHNPQTLKSPLDWADIRLAAAKPIGVAVADAPALAEPDPHLRPPLALQLPLLI